MPLLPLPLPCGHLVLFTVILNDLGLNAGHFTFESVEALDQFSQSGFNILNSREIDLGRSPLSN